MSRIAIINFTRMGDLIQSGPLLRSLKSTHPQAHLALVVFEGFRGAAERLPMVDEVIGFDVDRLVSGLDQGNADYPAGLQQLTELVQHPALQRPELALNLSHTPLSATLMLLLRPARSIGLTRNVHGDLCVDGEAAHYLFSVMQDRSSNPFNLVEIYQRFQPSGPFSPTLEFVVRDSDRRDAAELLAAQGIDGNARFVVLQPGASSSSRQWPPRAFASVARMLARQDIRSVVVGSKTERALGTEICALAGSAAVSLAGQTEVGTLAALLGRAERLVSNDTGTIHIAAAVGTPTIGIYLGPASAKDTAPYGSGHWILEPDLPCAPCSYHDTCTGYSCHEQISPRLVVELVLSDSGNSTISAEVMNGCRIYRTRVLPSGEFRLEPFNRASTGAAPHTLDFQRRFWNALLEWSGNSGAFTASTVMTDPALMQRLESASIQAAESIGRLVETLARQAERELPRALSAQLLWQDMLRACLSDFPENSALPRFLLTRIQYAPAGDLSGYLEQTSTTLDLLGKGVNLLKNLRPQSERARSHAAV